MDAVNRCLPRQFLDDLADKAESMLPDRDVADPWYTGDFDETFADLSEGCSALLTDVKAGMRTAENDE